MRASPDASPTGASYGLLKAAKDSGPSPYEEMNQTMKRHAKHLLMCSPMIVLAVVLLVLGAGWGVLIPLAACVLMMGAMMSMMPGGGDRGDRRG